MIQLAIILILAVSICFLTVFVLKSIFQPKKLDSIAKLIKQQRFVAAERAAKSLIAKNPRDYMAHYYLGKAYLADKKNELALMEFKIVNQNAIFDGHIPEVDFRKQISQLFIKFNQTDDALRECLLLTKLDPMNAENYYTCGKLYEQKGKSEQSIGFYQKAIQRNRKHVKAHAAYALALFRMKNVTEARKEIDLAIALSPETFSSYYYLGKILKEQKDYSGAVKAFEKALRDPEYKALFIVNPSNPPSYTLADESVSLIVDIVKRWNPNLMIITDDVYATYSPGFQSLLAQLPHNTMCVYSFSKYIC